MPYIPASQSTYVPPAFLRNGHLLTLWGSLMRKTPPLPNMVRVRLDTSDDDFVDVDCMESGGREKSEKRAVVISHGLEGNSRRSYMLAIATVFLRAGWDVFARNMRACSGEINKAPRMYHSGETDDLHRVIGYVLEKGYKQAALVGFSMGGNQTLKYLGEARLPGEIKAAVGISVPCDLTGAALELAKASRAIYMAYFMRTLKRKMREKHQKYPDLIPLRGLWHMHTFEEFDNTYTAPLHGFKSAQDYWEKASSLEALPRITVPTLLCNALDDPFLSPGCYPVKIARQSEWLWLETPQHGGHVGFVSADLKEPWGPYWDEMRTFAFVEQAVDGQLTAAGARPQNTE